MQARNKYLHLTVGCLAFAAVLLALAVFNWLARQDATTSSALPALQGEAAVEHLKQQGLYASLGEAMTATQYGIKSVPENLRSEHGNHYVANNPANNLRAGFAPERVELTPAAQSSGAWHLGITLRSAGYGDQQLKVDAGNLTTQGSRIEYERPVADGQSTIKEWYVNTRSGLEQGFTLAQAPGERPAGEPLRLTLAMESKLRAHAESDGQAVEFLDAAGNNVLRYDHLAVSDARGQTLAARMSVKGQELLLEVEDASAVYPVTIDPTFVQQAYLKASNTDARDEFGGAVAVSGDTVVVGAFYEASNATGVNGDQANNSASNSGAAYVFVRSGVGWSQQAYLKASNTDASDGFGRSVAVSGNTVVVGALNEDSNATGVNGDQVNNSASTSGAAYIFVRSGVGWSQQAYLKASNTGSGDNFGESLALSDDTLVVGAVGESSNAIGVNGNQADNSANRAGAAYVFVRSGGAWGQQAYLKASNSNAQDLFGGSVGVSGDTVVVGALGERSNATGVNGNQADNSISFAGAAYVFVRSGTAWSQQAYLKASNTDAGDAFYNVAISGDTVVVGARGEESNATGVNGDQTDNSATGSGAAYVFVRSGTTWSQQAYLKASNTGSSLGIGDYFGGSVALSGSTAVIGAPQEYSNATGVNGNQADNSAPLAGAAYVFSFPPIVVNTLADGAPANDGQCTLREALINANNNNQSGSTDCAAGNGADVITFSVTGTINLTGALPSISDTLNIAGPGANQLTVRRDTGGDYRIFDIIFFSGQGVKISDLTVTNGRSDRGAGISNGGTLNLANCVVAGNTATVNGGGIRSSGGVMTITDSTISGNNSDLGGGIYVFGGANVTITGSTISGNNAAQSGGIEINSSTITLTNSTISGNTTSALGAITNRVAPSNLTMTNCTVTGNQGPSALYTDPSPTLVNQLRNTLFAGNIGPNFSTQGAPLTSLGNNLDSDGTSGFTNGVGGNIVGTAQFKRDAYLGPLANNGGSTQTHALAPYSPAINAGIATGAPATDQRGFSRPYGGGVDIGAYELHAFYVSADFGNDANDGMSSGKAFKTVAKGIVATNNGGMLFIGAGTYRESLVVNKNITIQGVGAGQTIIDGQQLNRVFDIPGGVSVSLKDLTVTGGKAPSGQNGGGISNGGTLRLDDCVVTGNMSDAINNGGTLTINRSTISGNSGLGILSAFGPLTIANSTIIGNQIKSQDAVVTFTNVTISDGSFLNLAGFGTATVNLRNCTVKGGALYNEKGGAGVAANFLLRNTILAGTSLSGVFTSEGNNLASDSGGGFLSKPGDLINKDPKLGPLANNGGPTQTHALLRGSPAIDAGGGYPERPETDQRGLPREKDGNGDGLLAVDIGAYELSYRFVNVATGNNNNHGQTPTLPYKTVAHAITVAGDGEILILAAGTYPENNLEISKALSFEGAGAGQTIIDGQQLNRVFSIYRKGLNVGFSKLTIKNGKAPASGDDFDGGGILSLSDLTLTDCAIVNNEARESGGGVYLYQANGIFTGCTFSGNKAGLGGGAIFLLGNTGNTLQLVNSTVSDNSALGQGAGGGILNAPGGTLEVINSTVANNTGAAAGGIYTATIASVTTATTRLRNSILANTTPNLQKGVVDDNDVFTTGGPATITSLGNNLASDGGIGFLTGPGDQINKDARLSLLGNYGGPTQTHLLLCGSPAINAGNNTGAPTTDQRGVARPVGGTTDIGAVEGDYSLSLSATALPKGRVNITYPTQTLSATGGTAPYVFTAVTPLPGGLTLGANGAINGTPTTAIINFSFTVMAVDAAGKQGCRDYLLTIDPACSTITISPATLPNGQLGAVYNQQLTQSGGTGAIAWSFTGNLPGNVTLNSTTGLISGAPTASGTFNFNVTATDANGCASAPKAYSLVIATCPAITINPATLPGGQIGLQYSQQLTQTGGTGTLTWSVTGTLPGGVTLNTSSGLLSGKPTASGTFNFSVGVKDVNNCTATPKAYSLVIAPCPSITITPASLSPGTVGTQFSQLLTANGGTAPYAFSINPGSTLPPGLSLSGSTLVGSPTTANSFSFTMKVTDAAGCTGTQSYTLLVNPAITSNGLQFYPLAKPMRLLDTRPQNERSGPAFDLPGAKLAGEINGGTPRTQNARVSFDGLTIPANAKAIVGTATVVNYPGVGQYTGTGNVTFYPSNKPKPEVSNLNYAANQTISNGFTVALGDDGAFRIFSYSDVHLVIDVVGYYASPGEGGLYFHPLPRPLRALETRPQTFFPGCETPRVKLQAGSTRSLQGQFSCEGITIPASAKALVGNLTSVNAESNGQATVYAGDVAPLPLANTLSYVSTQAIPNAFVTRLSGTGNYNLFVSQTTDMLVDLTGYFSAEASDINGQGLLLTLLETPIRKLETRPELFYPGCITPRAPLAGGSETVIPALGTCQGVTIPGTAKALIGNATVVNFLSQGSGNVTMYPTAANRPESSNLNYVANQVIPNAFTVGLSADGKFSVYVFSTIHLLIDVTGYYAP